MQHKHLTRLSTVTYRRLFQLSHHYSTVQQSNITELRHKAIFQEAEAQRKDIVEKYRDHEPVTEEKIIQNTNWLIRPFVRLFLQDDIEELKATLNTSEALKREYQPQSPDFMRSNLVLQSKKRKNRSRLLQMLGFYRQDQIADKAAQLIWNTLEEQVRKFRADMYDRLGMVGSSWVNSDFFVWTLHIWALYRRLRFEGSDGDIISKNICDRFWIYVEKQLMRMGIGASTLTKNTRTLQEVHYGICVALDEIIVLDLDTDALIAEIVWRNLYSMGTVDSITGTQIEPRSRHLEFWVNYIHYLLSFIDHVDSILLTRGLFNLHDPSTSFVSGRIAINRSTHDVNKE
jgi:hypothetical protein